MKAVVFLLICLMVWGCGLSMEIPILSEWEWEWEGNNEKPGIKLAVAGKTFNYVAKQIIPFFEKELQGMEFPEIKQDISTPIGTVTFDISHFKLSALTLSDPNIQIIAGNEFSFVDSAVEASAHADWSYKDHSFPYVSDSGSLDVHLKVSILLKTGAKVDKAQKCGIQFLCTDIEITGWQSFDIDIHGGMSWLYNVVVSALKGTIEGVISDTIKSQVPAVVVDQTQQALNSLDLNIEIIDGIFFSFVMDDILFDVPKQYLGIGVDGSFYKGSIIYPGEPADLPDIISYDEMLSIFVSDYTVDSASYVCDKAGLCEYVLDQSQIPPEFPFQLNTSDFEVVIPKLYEMFPDEEMQLTFRASPDSPPNIGFTDIGLDVHATIDSVFQVKDKGEIKDAFTLQLATYFNGSVTVGPVDEQYIIKGNVEYQTMTMKLSQTIIGQFDVTPIQDSIVFLVKKILLPLLNDYLGKGIPLPDIPYFALQNTQVLYHAGYLEVRSDFTLTPP